MRSILAELITYSAFFNQAIEETMTHSDDYKRGLLDMLNALTVTENGGVFTMHSQGSDLRKSLDATIIATLEYRKELAERTKLDEAIKLLESNDYFVTPANMIVEYKKAAEYLRHAGYTVTKPDPNAADYPPGHPLHNPHAAKWVNGRRTISECNGFTRYADEPDMWINERGERVPFKRDETPVSRITD